MEKLGHSFIAHTEHLLQIWDETDPSPAGAEHHILDLDIWMPCDKDLPPKTAPDLSH